MANLEIKLAELRALESYFEADPKGRMPQFDHYQAAQDYKIEIARLIKKSWVSRTPTSTNFSGNKLTLPNFEAHFKYQREGIYSSLGISTYFGFQSKSQSQLYFTSSGQAANSSLLFALSRCYQLKRIKKSSAWYYETIMLLDTFLEKSSKPVKNLLFIDSSISLEFSILEKADYDFAIVDTTCLAIGSPEFIGLFEIVDKINKPIFFTRSHLKLDSFGLDYGNLGSVCAFNSHLINDFPEDLIVKRVRDVDPFFNFLNETGALLGVGMNIDQFYPFLGDPTVGKLNLSRINRIQKNHDDFVQSLSFHDGDQVQIRTTAHKLFFFVEYKQQVKMDSSLFLKLATLYRLNAKYCDSFGFDFLTHGNMIKYESGTEPTIVRFTVPDYSSEDLERSSELLNQYFKKIFS